MSIVFNPEQFKLDYPQFNQLSDYKLTNDFNYSAVVIGNVVSNLFTNDNEKYYWLCIVLAHMLTIEINGLTGRVSSVKQGSESINFDFNNKNGLEWWSLSPYGMKILQTIKQFKKGGHYFACKNPYMADPINVFTGSYLIGKI